MDQTVGEVSSGCGIRRGLALIAAREVRVQDLVRLRLVAHVDHAQTGRGREPVPVGSLRNPGNVILDERVIRGVGIHHTIHPDGSRVQHRILLGNTVLNFGDQQHVGVIVLLQELKGQTFFDLPAQDRQNHILSLFLVLV